MARGGESSKPTNNQIVPLTQLMRIGDGSKIDGKERTTEPKRQQRVKKLDMTKKQLEKELAEVRCSKGLLETEPLNSQQKSICLLYYNP